MTAPAPLRPCRAYPNCSALVPGGGYCEAHQRERNAKPWKQHGGRHRKLIGSAAWKRLRAAKLAADPMCQVDRCGIAVEVHHIDPSEERFFDMGNLLAVSVACHRRVEREADRGARYLT